MAGKADGQLWRPRRVAVTVSQRYVVCDRGQGSWRLQLFTPNGHFVRTIPLQDCDIVTSVVADGDEIVVIDSAKSKILVFSEHGRLLRHLDCSFCVREPSAMIAYEDDYYICDYKVSCSFASPSVSPPFPLFLLPYHYQFYQVIVANFGHLL